MSFLDDIVGGAKDLFGGIFGGGSGMVGSLISAAVTGFALNKVSQSVNKENESPPPTVEIDTGVRLQVDPSADQKIPVLYGTAVFGGIITEAVLSTDAKTMYYVLTLSERTGTKISDDQASEYQFKNIYWDDNRIVFNSDGITAAYTIDRDGNIDYNIANQVRVYCYAGSSTTPVVPVGYTNGSLPAAYSVVPNWTANHTMSDLVFAVVRIDYNRDRGITGMPNMMFNIENSMTLPGDCLYDYMTNTRYGAGVPTQEIFGE